MSPTKYKMTSVSELRKKFEQINQEESRDKPLKQLPSSINSTSLKKRPPEISKKPRHLSVISNADSDQNSSNNSNSHSRSQSENVISEILSTEVSYLAALKALVDIYKPVPVKLSILFSCISDLILLSSDLVEKFQLSHTNTQHILIENSNDILLKYTAFFKSLDSYATLEKNEETINWLNKCNAKLKDLNVGAWDLDSVIVKPVQRLLKYPLFLKEMLKSVDESDPQFISIKIAHEKFTQLAETINTNKKQYEVISKYQKPSKHNITHGITKKIQRGNQALKNITGISTSTVDVKFDSVISRFESLLDNLEFMQKDLTKMETDFQTYVDSFDDFFTSTLEAIDDTTSNRILLKKLKIPKLSKIDTDISIIIQEFEKPLKLIKKRNEKILDFDRKKLLIEDKEPVDKETAESADEFIAMNNQLITELALFCDNVDICVLILERDIFHCLNVFVEQITYL